MPLRSPLCGRLVRVLILAGFLALSFLSGAQEAPYDLQVYDNAQGIRPGNILGVARDHDGYLWILYPRFVQRFDGRQATRFNAAGFLEQIFVDAEGGVWVTGSAGTFRFDHRRRTFQPVEVRPDDAVDSRGRLLEDHRGRVLLVTVGAIHQWDRTSGTFVPWDHPLGIKPPFNVRASEFRQGFLYLSRGGQVCRVNIGTGEVDSLLVSRVRRLHWITSDSLLASSWDLESYWVDFNAMTVAPVRLPPDMQEAHYPMISVRSVARTGPGEYLVAAREGLFRYDLAGGRWSRVPIRSAGRMVEAYDFASEVTTDADGSIWMVAPDGLYRTFRPEEGFALVRFREDGRNLPSAIDNIRAMARGQDGHLWIATGNGFVAYDPGRGTSRIYLPEEGRTDRLAFPSVRSIAADDRYVVLGPADLGIWLFDPATGQYRRPVYADTQARALSEGDFFDHLCTLPDGNLLCMGRDAIYALEAGTYVLRTLDVPPGKENSNYAYVGPAGEIWVTTMKGLHLLHADLTYDRPVPLPEGNQVILAGTVLQDGTFLFAAEQGIMTARRMRDRVEIDPYALSLRDKLITGLFMDARRGVLWITCEDGIYRYETATGRLNLYDHADNVQGYGFNANVILPTPDGRLYFGGLNGINVIRPDRFRVEPGPLQVHIEEVTGGSGRSLSGEETAVLPYRDRSIEARFACPQFSSPEKITYRYRLVGYETEWRSTGNSNTVRIASLPPGRYDLQVAASLNGVDWVPASSSFGFRIKAPFWMTGWFIAGVMVMVLLALYAFVRNRNLRLTAKQEELEAEQAINYFSLRMTEYEDPDRLLWDVAQNCIGRLRFEDCVIYLLDDARGVLVQRAALGPKRAGQDTIASPIEIPVGRGITGSVAATGEAEIIPDTRRDPRYITDDQPRLSEIAVPIMAGGQVLGVIDCEHSRKGFFTQRHLSVLTTLASLVAAKLVKAKAEEEKRAAEQQLMATRHQLADIEMQALRAQMNPHFIFNCLNSINRYIVKSDQATASLYLTRFAKLIRLILDNSNSKSVTLANELEALRLYIEMESIRFEKQFSWRIDIDPEVHPDHVYVPPLIIQPYVENAIWHGLLHKPEAGRLSVRIGLNGPQALRCIIEDNGVGRARARELKSKTVTGNKSLGMKLTEDRLALLSRHAAWQATVDVEDLYDSSGAPAGTRVVLTLPIDA